MLDPFLVEYKLYVFAGSQADAAARLRVWRALAVAAGFDPGPGRVSSVPAAQLAREPRLAEELECARAKDPGAASARQRERAIDGLARHLAGDMGLAAEVVASIEEETGPLSVVVARSLQSSGRRVRV